MIKKEMVRKQKLKRGGWVIGETGPGLCPGLVLAVMNRSVNIKRSGYVGSNGILGLCPFVLVYLTTRSVAQIM
jgi:hypothetical protein